MKTINININGQQVSTARVLTVNGTVKVIECEFTFNGYWDGYPTKKAIFKNNNMNDSFEAVIVDNKCIVPWESLRREGIVKMAIVGSNTGGQVERSETIPVIVQCKTLQGGVNSIDPTPDQYSQFIERAGEAIEGYFEEHHDEFVGPPGPPGDDYVLTEEDREEIAGIVGEDLEPVLAKKMEYYAVTIQDGQMVHDGVVQTYEDILAAFNDNGVFLYLSYLNLIFIPSFVVAGHEEEGRDAVEFASAYYYAEEPTIARVIINSAEQIKYDQIVLENTDWKVDDLTGWTVGEYPQAYPTADAVATQFDSVKESLNQKADKSEIPTDYVKSTDYATQDKGGVMKINPALGVYLDNGTLRGSVANNDGFNASGNSLIISKGTLNNVLAERLKEPQFELIEEITLTEDVASIERTAEPNGNPYSFKRIKIIVILTQMNDRRNYLFRANNNLIFAQFYSVVNATYSTFVALNIEIDGGFVKASSSYALNGNANVISQGTSFNGLADIKANSINKIKIDSAVMPVGTNIKIYGIRA